VDRHGFSGVFGRRLLVALANSWKQPIHITEIMVRKAFENSQQEQLIAIERCCGQRALERDRFIVATDKRLESDNRGFRSKGSWGFGRHFTVEVY
jgi:hypothetical protein